MAATADSPEFDAAVRQVTRYRPDDIGAVNHNDLRSFVHAWFAAFDHRAPTEYFLDHLDDADMTFNLDGEALATDHASFSDWYADALKHFPWDFHDLLDGVLMAGVADTGWTAEFHFRHVGEWIDDPATGGTRPFNRVMSANWRLEHDGRRFGIRRYELALAQNVIAI